MMSTTTRNHDWRPTLRRAAETVYWSYFGVRNKEDCERDAAKIAPLQVIAAGMVVVAVVELALVAILHF
jgi:hypothetical protein